jgi:hypothetical protein
MTVGRRPVNEWPSAPALDEATFRHEIVERCRPIVIRQACAGWPVLGAAQQSDERLAAYLRQLDSGRKAEAFQGTAAIAGRYHYGENLEGFNFERKPLGLAEALQRMAECAAEPERGTLYMGSLPVSRHLPGFEAENRLSFLSPEIEPRVWIGNASLVSCHYDTFDNLACVVAGIRRFTLYPPDAIGDLYVGPIDHTMAGPPISLAAGSAPGDPRYPRFEAARERALSAELRPGDALYLPKLWWHQVEAASPFNLLVNYWWDAFRAGPDAPNSTMMLAMIAIAERPAPERAAWRAFFDHYVFRPHGHPLAHLPEERHGILGPLSQGNYRRLRAAVMQMLRGG